MDIRKVKKLIELLEESGIDELEIREGEESVRISRHSKNAPQPMYAAPPMAAMPRTNDLRDRADNLDKPGMGMRAS
jgi:acetyl-CoA carboxylase biotin carboxyl carrier protein